MQKNTIFLHFPFMLSVRLTFGGGMVLQSQFGLCFILPYLALMLRSIPDVGKKLPFSLYTLLYLP